MVKFLKQHRIFISLFSLSVIIFLWDVLLLKGTFLYGDYKQQFFPWYMEYAKAIKAFRLPFWSQYMGCGFPLLAEGQVGALYPLNLVTFFLLPALAAYNYSIALHFMLGGIFMYIFMQRLGLKGLPAALPAILFMFSSPYAGCFSNIASLKVLCWLPLVYYLILYAFRKGRPYLLIFSGLIMGVQLLAGAAQMAVYSIMASIMYFVLLLSFGEDKIDSKIKYVIFFAVSLLAAFIIFSPQYIATQRLVSFSGRASSSLDFALWSSFFPLGILTLVLPHLAVLFRAMIYIGILPLIFCMASFYSIKNRQVLFFWVLFAIALLMSFGKFNPFYVLMLKLTKFYFFRTPTKFLFFSAFYLTILSGFGLDHILERLNVRSFRAIRNAFLAVIGSSLGLVICGGIFMHIFKAGLLEWGRWYVSSHIYNTPLHRYSLEHYLSRVNGFYDAVLKTLDVNNIFIYASVIFSALAVGLMLLLIRNRAAKRYFQVSVSILVFIDLCIFSSIGPGFRGNIVSVSGATKRTAVLDYLKADDSLFRVYYFDPQMKDSEFKPNFTAYFGINNLGMYTPLAYKRYQRLLGDLGCVDDSMGAVVPSEAALRGNLNLLGMLNVKYVVSNSTVLLPGLRLVKDFGDTKLYLNDNLLPRAFMVYGAIVMKESEALDFIKSSSFDPRKIVVLEEPFSMARDTAAGSVSATVSIERYSDREVIVNVVTPQEGMFVLTDYYYPGWQAYLDGAPAKIYRANLVARGVMVPGGNHKIRFVYERPLF